MIVWCSAIPVDEMHDKLLRRANRGTPLVDGYGFVACIGIEPRKSPLREFKQEQQLILNIPDTLDVQDMPKNWSPELKEMKRSLEIPQLAEAQAIAAFTKALHRDYRPWALLVHCYAGISRSPAVATWVRQTYDIDIPKPHLRWAPNATLLRLLRTIKDVT